MVHHHTKKAYIEPVGEGPKLCCISYSIVISFTCVLASENTGIWARDWPLYSVYHSIQLIVTGRGDMAVIRTTQVTVIEMTIL